jgi:hypothetical protein
MKRQPKPKCIRTFIGLPVAMREELTRLREQGYTVAGYVKHLVETDLQRRREMGLKGR